MTKKNVYTYKEVCKSREPTTGGFLFGSLRRAQVFTSVSSLITGLRDRYHYSLDLTYSLQRLVNDFLPKMTQINLPFKVGDAVEAKSFELGFRGAWFQCKITKIFKKGRALFYNLEYLDFPGEGIHATKVYQKPNGGDQSYLMIRPPYPRVCRENEVLSKEAGVEEVVVVHDVWRVGDLVDWWKDYCYWLGTVMEVREDKTVKIELLPEPHGEGNSYDGLSKDLRPSLEWSLEQGWSVLVPKEGENRPCAKLMKLSNEDEVKEGETREEQVQGTAQKSKDDGALMLNIVESESIEAAAMDLEELIVRIEWVKEMLSQDVSTFSETSFWKYEDYAPSSKRM